jgi:peroxiredoxin
MQGQRIPENVVFRTRVRDASVGGDNPFRWQDVESGALFRGRRVVVFSLPGAFTPTCSNQQCPAFERYYDEFRSLGVDEVYCISVNDAFVMYQWGRHLGVERVKMLPDGNGAFTRRMGMLVWKGHLGFGYRSWRYTMVVNDCTIEKFLPEPGINDTGSDSDPYTCTNPEPLLDYLKAAAK